MVDIKKSKLILGIFIPILAFFLMSQNVFAENLETSRLGVKYNPDNQGYRWSGDMLYGAPTGGTNGVTFINLPLGASYANKYYFKTPTITTKGNYATIHYETNLVLAGVNSTYLGKFPPENLPYMDTIDCNGSTGAFSQAEIISRDKGYDVTYWGDANNRVTLTFRGTFTLRNVGQGSSGSLTCTIGSEGYAFLSTANIFSTTYINRFYFEQNPMSIDYSNNINDALLQQQVYQQQTLINITNEYYDRERQGEDNISNQRPEDIQGGSNNQTTSLINVITGFIGAFSSINPTNCNLTLEFPDYAGGSRVVDICSGKEKAPRIIEIGSSLLLICVFVPLAFVVIRMIYNEIRSWTNG